MDSCGFETTLIRSLKNHLFIDVESLESFSSGEVFQCYLQKIPEKMNFEKKE